MRRETEIRDRLARIRTELAAERTLLSWIRTSLALIGGGFALVQFMRHLTPPIIGWGVLLAGIGTLLLGLARFRQTRQRIEKAIED